MGIGDAQQQGFQCREIRSQPEGERTKAVCFNADRIFGKFYGTSMSLKMSARILKILFIKQCVDNIFQVNMSTKMSLFVGYRFVLQRRGEPGLHPGQADTCPG
jgi:hypothetical protein